jgi:hypothetical protein
VKKDFAKVFLFYQFYKTLSARSGRVIKVKEVCTIRGRIESLEFDTKAIPVEVMAK